MTADSELRVGTGVDVHAFDERTGGEATPNSVLRLAGIEWPGEPVLSGHSDGDAVCHAVVDALLSAAGLGSIGELVGVDLPDTAGAASAEFVACALERLSAERWEPVNVSVQLIAQRPRFAARRAEAEARMSELVGAPVSMCATTSDGLGFTGRGAGIAVIATALVRRS